MEDPWVAAWVPDEERFGFYLDGLEFRQWAEPKSSVGGWFFGQMSDGVFRWRELATGATSDRPPPLVQAPWRALWSGPDGRFFFENTRTWQTTWEEPPSTPVGWEARWCDRHEEFYYRNEAHEQCFWELDVPVLQCAGLLENIELTAVDVRKAYKRAALRLHPDKGGDPTMWKDCLLYTSPSPRDATLSRMPSSA